MKVKGLKRMFAGLLLSLISVLQASGEPLALLVVPILQGLASLLGVVGVAHAAVVEPGSLKKYLAATLGALIAIATLVPALAPILPLLNAIGALFGISALVRRASDDKIELLVKQIDEGKIA